MKKILLGLVAAVALGAGCDGDTFETPDGPDRSKGPLDFGIPYLFDASGSAAPDLSVGREDLGSAD